MNVNHNIERGNLSFAYDREFELVKIPLGRVLKLNDEIILDIIYQGVLRDNGTGLFRSSYSSYKELVGYTATHFETSYARFALPCYDEPGIRAVIGLKIQHDIKHHAVSNMAIVKISAAKEIGNLITTFEETPPMQTYLLAFIISDFEHLKS